MDIGSRIKQQRRRKRLTLQQLGKSINMSVSFLSDIEKGRANPSLKRLIEIAKGLEIPVSVLLRESLEKEQLTPEFKELLEYIRDYSDWSESDRIELLSYLRARQIVRKS